MIVRKPPVGWVMIVRNDRRLASVGDCLIAREERAIRNTALAAWGAEGGAQPPRTPISASRSKAVAQEPERLA
jgi:hypothetical protein